MLLVAAGLKCLDPALTIVCCLARDDPFITPASPEERKIAIMRKYDLAPDHLSDHLALLRAYHLWEKANDEGRKRQVAKQHITQLIFLITVFGLDECRSVKKIISQLPTLN